MAIGKGVSAVRVWLDDRWRWLEANVVPRFRKLNADPCQIDASPRRIFDEARVYASAPCVLPFTSTDREGTDPTR